MLGEHRDLRWSSIADSSRLSSFLQRQLVVLMMMMTMMMITTSSSPVLIRLTFRSYADSQHFPVAKLHQAPVDANADADYDRRFNAF
jgi:hypothetical protein